MIRDKNFLLVLALLLTISVLSACNASKAGCNLDRIAFVSDRDGNDEIYIINADGSDLMRLTNNPATDTNPNWSPDGCQIALVSERDGNRELYLLKVEEAIKSSSKGGLTRLTNNPGTDHGPVWSPDSARIVFTTQKFTGSNTEISMINVDGSNLHLMTDKTSGEDLCIVAGNVGFWDKEECLKSLKKMNTDEQSMDDRFLNSFNPVWSPDGQMIAFVSGSCTGDSVCNFGVYVINADGSGLTRLSDNTEWYRIDGYPNWSINNQQVSFLCSGTDLVGYKICSANIIYGNWIPSADGRAIDMTSDAPLIWSPTGTQFAFSTSGDIIVMNADGSGLTNLTNSVGHNSKPIWLSDGQRIVFVSNRDGNKEIYMVNVDGSSVVRLTNNIANDRLIGFGVFGDN